VDGRVPQHPQEHRCRPTGGPQGLSLERVLCQRRVNAGPKLTLLLGEFGTTQFSRSVDLLVAALHIVDTEGRDALSMRHLAHSLNREAMTLYRYAAYRGGVRGGR